MAVVSVLANTGLFGAIWGLITGGAIIKDKIKGSIKDSQNKDKARYEQTIGNNPYGTYHDHKGVMRLIVTNQIVSIRPDPWTHEWYLEDVYGNKLRNLTQEKKQQKISYAQNHYDKLHTVVCIKDNKEKLYKDFEFNEPIYQDILTGRQYVVRIFKSKFDSKKKKYERNYEYKKLLKKEIADQLGDLSFYMDTQTGFLVRLSDSYLRQREELRQRKERKISDENIQKLWKKYEFDFEYSSEFIEKFNEYQKERITEMDLVNDKWDFIYYFGGESNGWDCETDHKKGY